MRLATETASMGAPSGSVDTSNLMLVCRSGEAINVSLLRDLLGYFVNDNSRRLTEAAAAAAAGDTAAIQQLAHAIRGSAALFGARRLHELAGALDRDALPEERAALEHAVRDMTAEFAAVLQALRERHPEAWRE